jgi:hypothetical protein
MGMMAAMTVKVASTRGPRTSETASTMISERPLPRDWGSLRWRTMFSTSTMGSSTRMPMQKMRAKRVTRLRV